MTQHVADFGKLVRDEMDKYGLRDKGWEYGYDKAKKRLGLCNYREKLLTFSLPYVEVNTIDNMHDTILHEIAHALMGAGAGHSPAWRDMARRVGATPRACAVDPNIVRPVGDYAFACNCRIYYFHRSDALGSPKWCRKCNLRGRVVRTSSLNIEYKSPRVESGVFVPAGFAMKKPSTYQLLLGE